MPFSKIWAIVYALIKMPKPELYKNGTNSEQSLAKNLTHHYLEFNYTAGKYSK